MSPKWFTNIVDIDFATRRVANLDVYQAQPFTSFGVHSVAVY